MTLEQADGVQTVDELLAKLKEIPENHSARREGFRGSWQLLQ
jgi:hypothetical protein